MPYNSEMFRIKQIVSDSTVAQAPSENKNRSECTHGTAVNEPHIIVPGINNTSAIGLNQAVRLYFRRTRNEIRAVPKTSEYQIYKSLQVEMTYAGHKSGDATHVNRISCVDSITIVLKLTLAF